MMNLSKAEYQALLRTDLSMFFERSFRELNPDTPYLHNWHIDKMAEVLEDCRKGKITRLILNVPPRSLKSHCTSIAFVAWLLGHNPSKQIICASYAQDLAEKLALDCRSLMLSPFYQQLFPTRLSRTKTALHDFTTTARGSRLATSVGGVLTGRGADIILIDDPLKPDQAVSESQRRAVNDWYDHTLCSRLNDKRTGCIILIMQRLHGDDLVGHLEETGGWTVLRFPAIAEEDETHVIRGLFGVQTVHRLRGEALHPEREPLHVLERMRRELGEYNFSGQYQQAPAPPGGGMVKREWFKTYHHEIPPSAFESIFQSWDTANKATELSDYSVCTTWGVKNKELYLLHVFRERLDYPGLKRAVVSQEQLFGPKVILIEDKCSGTQLIQELLYEKLHAIKRYEPKEDKIMRMHAVSSTIENGFVYLPDKADWLQVYLQELITFPRGKHDDQVDSTSQALDWFRQGHMRTIGAIEYYAKIAERVKAETERNSGHPPFTYRGLEERGLW
jgi:predicted phage terminase large subunit-like protein